MLSDNRAEAITRTCCVCERKGVVMASWVDLDFGCNDAGGDFPWKTAAEILFLDAWSMDADDVRRHHPGVYTARIYGPPLCT